MDDYLVSGPTLETDDNCPTWLLAHGAGAAMDSDFMNSITSLVSVQAIRVVRFEFAYMAARRVTGKKAPPPKAEKLMPEFDARIKDIAACTNGPLFIGGKSMGGRIATMVADARLQQNQISGVICLGYPFHPPGKPEKLRTSHLKALVTPALICQGERDAFGTHEEIEALHLSETITLNWAVDGNHDLKPRKASGTTHQQNLTQAANACASFMKNL